MLKIFLPLLSLLLIGLKLTGYIAWSWFVVLLPVLFPFVILSILLAGIAICAGLIGIINIIQGHK